jgi:uncharacterized protein
MLIEFKVKNFRSFKDEYALSLVASPDRTHQLSRVVQTPIRAIPGLLRSVAIYGANASGKSNLIRALQLMRVLVADSATLQVDQKLNVQSFALDMDTKDEPTEFEVTFLVDQVRYQYGFTLKAERILSEWLIVYKTAKPQTWFRREFNLATNKDDYTFGPSLVGQRNVWQKSTRTNALFLSTAVQLNSEQLRPVFDWLSRMVIFENGATPIFFHTVNYILQNPQNNIQNLMTAADIGIANIEIVKRKGMTREFKLDLATGNVDSTQQEQDNPTPLFSHVAPHGNAVFEFQDESEGTQRLFAFAGPLFEIFRDGRVLCVDELDRSLHTLLVRQLVSMFHDPNINTGGAQLIFTTHDTALLDSDIFRRDQIWFTEKNSDQASQLYPLTDFSARKNEAFEKGYLSGRYGGIPILQQLKVSAIAKQ